MAIEFCSLLKHEEIHYEVVRKVVDLGFRLAIAALFVAEMGINLQ